MRAEKDGLASCSAMSILRSGFGRIIRCGRSEQVAGKDACQGDWKLPKI